MKKFEEKKLTVEYLYVAVFTTVTVLMWVGFEVFRSVITPAKIPQVTAEELRPLPDQVNQGGLEGVRQREHVPQEILNALEVTPISIGEKAVTQASESATIESLESIESLLTQEEATQSGTSE